MFNIGKFTQILNEKVSAPKAKLESITQSIKEKSGVIVSSENILSNGDTLYLSCTPAEKNKILLNSSQILEDLAKFGIKRIV